MAEILVIAIPEDVAGNASWLVVDEQGELRAATQHGPLANAVPLARERRVWVVLDWMSVTRTSTDLPVRGARLASALPYALEEQFAEDVELLHFAAGAADENGVRPVAALDRAAFEQLLQTLAAAGLRVDAVYSLHDALPALTGFVQLLVTPEATIVRQRGGELSGLAAIGPADVLEAVTAAVDDDDGDETTAPEQLRIYCDAEAFTRYVDDWAAIRTRHPDVDIKQLERGTLAFAARTLTQRPGINLLQGRYAPGSDWLAHLRPWFSAAALVVVALVLALLGQYFDMQQQQREAAQLDQEIVALLARTGNRSADAATAEALLGSLVNQRNRDGGATAASGGPAFLATLDTLARAMGNDEATMIEAISYRNGVFDIRLTTGSTSSLETLRKRIADAPGLTAEIQRSEQQEDGVKSFLQVRGEPS